ncbi:MAG: beta-galactosidase [Treponema sp.]|jgi:beta-galactosidase|nr:beta-galactosidase [Treponema sp.]
MEIFDRVITGVSYYPEHWGRENWKTDIENIVDMGMSVVRLAELSWGVMESEDGKFNFDWLEDFIDTAGKKGLKIVLGTPSEATTVWLRAAYPEIVRVDEAGIRHGGRGMHCHTSPVFRFYTGRITAEMANRFGGNPHVIGWQIDNEFRAVDCYCSACRHAFQVWLKNKYETIEKLNNAWGTWFWSQHYNSFEEVELPALKEVTISTSQILDYKRFVSWSTVDFQSRQIEIIRRAAPHQFISHNSLGLYPNLNMYDLARDLDIMAWDAYPHVDEDFVNMAKTHDLIRAAKHGNFWMLEQKNGYFNGSDYNLAITPGLVRAWGMFDISRGANGVLFYRYRANRWGQEQNPNGILRHDGSKRRAYFEIQQMNRELAPLSEKLGKTTVEAAVALIHNYDDIWSAQAKKQYTNFDCHKLEDDFYRVLLSLGITPDLIHPEDDLSPYKIVIAPNLFLLSQKTADNMKRFVESGGAAVFHIRCGQKDTGNVMVDIPWPGLVRELLGVTVDEFEAFPDHMGNSATYKGKTYPIRWWADVLNPDTAQAEALYAEKFYRGKPAVTARHVGKGRAVYFGVAGCRELIGDYLGDLFRDYGIKTIRTPDKVYITTRKNREVSYTFIINLGTETKEIDPCITGTDLITGKKIGMTVQVAPLETLIIEHQ